MGAYFCLTCHTLLLPLDQCNAGGVTIRTPFSIAWLCFGVHNQLARQHLGRGAGRDQHHRQFLHRHAARLRAKGVYSPAQAITAAFKLVAHFAHGKKAEGRHEEARGKQILHRERFAHPHQMRQGSSGSGFWHPGCSGESRTRMRTRTRRILTPGQAACSMNQSSVCIRGPTNRPPGRPLDGVHGTHRGRYPARPDCWRRLADVKLYPVSQ